MDGSEQWGYGEHVVLDDTAVVTYEMEHLGLGSARTMHHTVNLRTQFVEQTLDDRGVGAGGGEDQLSHRQPLNAIKLLVQQVLSAIDQFVGYGVVVALRVFLCEIFGKDVVAGTCESVGPHTSVVAVFIGGLTCGGKTHDDVSRTNVGIVDDVAAFHAASHGRVHDDGAYQVAHVGSLATCGIDANTHFAQFCQQLVGTINDGGNDVAGNEHLIAADGTGDKDVVHGTHAKEVIGIHHDGVLGDALPYTHVARLLPIHIGQARLGACAVGMHDIAILRVTAQDVGDNLAESLRVKTFVNVLDGGMHVFLGCTDATHHIAVVHDSLFRT